MDRNEADQIVAELVAGFPGSRLADANADAYAQDISDLDYDAARRAVTRLRQDSDRLPSIAGLRRAVNLEHANMRGGNREGAVDYQGCPLGMSTAREDLPGVVLDAVTELEHALNAPLCPAAIDQIGGYVRSMRPEGAARAVRLAVVFAGVKDPTALVRAVAVGWKAPDPPCRAAS